MRSRTFAARGLGSLILVTVFAIGVAPAQVGAGINVGYGSYFGAPYYGGGPGWGYPGLYGGGPFVGYPWYRGAYGGFWTNGLSLYGPPVPVYGPVPGVFGNSDLVRAWEQHPAIGPGFGWIGIYSASPRPKPATVSVWPAGPVLESVPVVPAAPAAPAEAAPAPAGCLILSVKVPQPQAEVYVDGVKTAQTGTDRLFESPPLTGGNFQYEVTARWVERGGTVEVKRTATGRPGDVVRLDFTKPEEVPVAAGK